MRIRTNHVESLVAEAEDVAELVEDLVEVEDIDKLIELPEKVKTVVLKKLEINKKNNQINKKMLKSDFIQI